MLLRHYTFDFYHESLKRKIILVFRISQGERFWFWPLHENPYSPELTKSAISIDASRCSYTFFSVIPATFHYSKNQLKNLHLENWIRKKVQHFFLCIRIPIVSKNWKVLIFIYLDVQNRFSTTKGLICSITASIKQYLLLLVQDNSIAKWDVAFFELKFW